MMRALTDDEMLLVAGGFGNDTREDEAGQAWFHDAFDWLSDALGWLGELTPGWLGDYIGGFSDVTDSMHGTGDLINCHDDWTDYYIDQASSGGDAMDFDQWYQTIDPATCDTDSGLSDSTLETVNGGN